MTIQKEKEREGEKEVNSQCSGKSCSSNFMPVYSLMSLILGRSPCWEQTMMPLVTWRNANHKTML